MTHLPLNCPECGDPFLHVVHHTRDTEQYVCLTYGWFELRNRQLVNTQPWSSASYEADAQTISRAFGPSTDWETCVYCGRSLPRAQLSKLPDGFRCAGDEIRRCYAHER